MLSFVVFWDKYSFWKSEKIKRLYWGGAILLEAPSKLHKKSKNTWGWENLCQVSLWVIVIKKLKISSPNSNPFLFFFSLAYDTFLIQMAQNFAGFWATKITAKSLDWILSKKKKKHKFLVLPYTSTQSLAIARMEAFSTKFW